jgi:hypothetical protein
MTAKLRPVLAVIAVLLLAIAMSLKWGFFTPAAVLSATAALVTLWVACSLPDLEDPASSPAASTVGDWLLALLALGLSGYGMAKAEVLSRLTVAQAEATLPWLARLGFGVVLSLLLHLVTRSGKWRHLLPMQIGLVFLVGTQLRVDAVLAVPDPVVDVYNAFRDGADHLLAGHNPYTADYEHPYATPPADYDRYPFYPPLPLLVILPIRAAGLDVRFANVICDLLAALVLLELGRGRGRLLAGAFATSAYLFFPRVPFMMEQAWYEPMLAVCLGGGLLLVERGRRLGYLLLGLGLTGKQYGPVLLLPLLWAYRRRWRPLLLGVAGVAAVVILPFLLLNPAAFLDVIFFAFLRRPPRADALTIQVGAQALLGGELPTPLLWAVAGVAIAWITWRTPPKGTATALWMGTALLTFCLLHKQGFFNYFYLCEYLCLFGITSLLTEPAHAEKAEGRTRISLTPGS